LEELRGFSSQEMQKYLSYTCRL